MRSTFLRRFGLPVNCRQQFLDSVAKLMDEPVEVVVGNHLGNYDALEKVRRREETPDAPNPFVDPSEWKRLLTGKAELVRQLMIDDPVE
jgi:metallo-beta-lactamase class B